MSQLSAARVTKRAPVAKTASATKTPAAKTTQTPPADRTRAQRRSKLLAFLSDPPRDVLTAAQQLGLAREHYGDDTKRELADFETGRHVLQRRRASASR